LSVKMLNHETMINNVHLHSTLTQRITSHDRLTILSLSYQLFGVLVIVVVSLHLKKFNDSTPYMAITIIFTVYMIMYLSMRLLLDCRALVQGLVFFYYFLLLLIGYFVPEISWYEFLFLPCIMLEFVLLFPFAVAIAFEIFFGMIGSVVFSNHFILESSILVKASDLPLSLVSACFYIPLSLAFILLARYRQERIKEKAHLLQILDLNRRLEGINRNINQKLFSIQQDSYQTERMRITKEIHDTAGYVFINIIMLLQTALAVLNTNRELGESKINDALDHTRRGMNEIRYILREMRNYEKPSLGLQKELFEIADLFKKATGVHVNMEYGNWPSTFGKKLDLFFISLLQESLTNSLKHGHASSIDMICWEHLGEVMILVKDNGKGQDTPIVPGIGLSGIKDFIDKVEGTLEITSDQTGFMLRVSISQNAIDRLQKDSGMEIEADYYGLEYSKDNLDIIQTV